MTADAGHALVVGGTGMLADAVRTLAAQGWRVSVFAREAEAFAAEAGVNGFNCDYHDEAAFLAALERAKAANGPIGLAVAWFHTLRIPAPRRLAEAVGGADRPGRYVQVVGSAMADPARPDRLAFAASVVEGAPHCLLRQVVLGFQLEAGGARWLTNAEISQGVLEAISRDAPLSVIGVTEPWSARPGA